MIVSIDPGRKSGVAVFDDEPGPIDHIGLHGFYLHSWRLVKMLPSEAHGRVALSILREIGVGIGDIVVVEAVDRSVGLAAEQSEERADADGDPLRLAARSGDARGYGPCCAIRSVDARDRQPGPRRYTW